MDNLAAQEMAVDSDTFLLNPNYRDFVLGKSQTLTRKRIKTDRIGFFAVSIFLLYVEITLVLVGRDVLDWAILNQSDSIIIGQYIDRRISSSDGGDDYYVSFRYRYEGKVYEREQRVSEAVYSQAVVGGNVQIVYLPSNPQSAKLRGTDNIPPFADFLFGLILNTIACLLFSIAIRRRRRRFLERNGKVLRGKIVQTTFTADSEGDAILKVEYSFNSPQSKQAMNKVESAVRNDLLREPVPGTPVVVLYYNERQYMLL